MPWLVGTGADDSVIVNLSTGERGDMVEQYNAQVIPQVYVIDHEGYIVQEKRQGLLWMAGILSMRLSSWPINTEAEDLRFFLEKVDRSAGAIFVMGPYWIVIFPLYFSFTRLYLLLC